ncbi:hypothetical protein [Kitasatospora sp. NPDC088134]|uniref:hypothetical protein n=1 Tax=Kitasatospora sp. NPDC088134 TaxID=3364071 RepID=UPI003801670D
MRPRRTSSTIPAKVPAHRPGRRNPLALRGRARYPAPLCRRARSRYGNGYEYGCVGRPGAGP